MIGFKLPQLITYSSDAFGLNFGRSTWLLTIKIRRCRFLNQLQCSPSQQRLPNTQGKAEWHSWIHGISMAFPWHLKIFGYICLQSPYYVAFFWNSFCRWWCNFCCNAESKTLFSIGGRPIRTMWRANGGIEKTKKALWLHGMVTAFPWHFHSAAKIGHDFTELTWLNHHFHLDFLPETISQIGLWQARRRTCSLLIWRHDTTPQDFLASASEIDAGHRPFETHSSNPCRNLRETSGAGMF